MPETKPAKIPVNVTLDTELLNQAREAGLREGRTLSNWIERLIRKELSHPKA